ncbi:HutD family protein [Bdellovibrio bacteriovorus]|uniref:HutD-family protein n=1 Tax=Bdellovibrio bacteriovorus str. Tiberius TaxID=1069642 RepID=K7YYZ4_BDEBC|nr:HutD family protein [Bdellovibrio bacteriovorus]AFY01915.1 hypothetical protein Bdt_2231 [Bdellovibrio bacteriovorus str. Tiberius]
MIQLLKSSSYQRMPWKNGLGVTDQIDLAASEIKSSQPYAWRLSSALVAASNPFSIFEGYNRLLSVVEGDGLILNQNPLLPLQVCEFSGDDHTDCQLIGSPVRDLGLIFNPKTHRARMQFHTLPNVSESVFSLREEIQFFYVVQGKMRMAGQTAEAQDCFKLTQETQVKIQNTGSETLGYYQISLSHI